MQRGISSITKGREGGVVVCCTGNRKQNAAGLLEDKRTGISWTGVTPFWSSWLCSFSFFLTGFLGSLFILIIVQIVVLTSVILQARLPKATIIEHVAQLRPVVTWMFCYTAFSGDLRCTESKMCLDG